ncbi:MAG: hypothetical protein PHN56_00470 [Candidatus Nanoarchaeia archaeon]|nr:hypothetical protein [Candidatus Nanoarchaeia archaeon]
MSMDYRTVSVKLTNKELTEFKRVCDTESKNYNSKLKELINESSKNIQNFISGKNKLEYNKLNNTFSWKILNDDESETTILDNLQIDFINNLQNEIIQAINERNDWVKQSNKDSIIIPKKIIRGKK